MVTPSAKLDRSDRLVGLPVESKISKSPETLLVLFKKEYVKSGKHAWAFVTMSLETVSPALSSNLSNLPSV